MTVTAGRLVERHGLVFVELERSSNNRASFRWPGRERADGLEGDPFTYFERLSRVRNYVDSHFDQRLTVAVVAAVVAMAPSSFRRFFRRHVGRTFSSWLAHYRIEHACQLLRSSNLSVSEVAKAVGCRWDRTFRRVFNRHTGMSPSRYRKRYRPPRHDLGHP